MKKVKRFTACLLTVATALMAPGLEPYRVWAQIQDVEPPAAPFSIAVPGPLEQPPLVPATEGSLPDLILSPAAGQIPVRVESVRTRGSGLVHILRDRRALPIARASVGRASSLDGSVGRLRPAQPVRESSWLSPPPGILRVPGKARRWAQASFSALAGAGPSAVLPTVDETEGLGPSPTIPVPAMRRPVPRPSRSSGLSAVSLAQPSFLGGSKNILAIAFAWLGRSRAAPSSSAPSPGDSEAARLALAVSKELFYARAQNTRGALPELKAEAATDDILRALSRSLGLGETRIESLAFQKGLARVGRPEAWRQTYAAVREMQVKEEGNRRSAYREDIFGFRRVSGIVGDALHKPLASNAKTQDIVRGISRQFRLSQDQIAELARRYGLSMVSEREKWLNIHDSLQDINAREFKRLDVEKYKAAGRGKWIPRVLLLVAGASYAAMGWTVVSAAALAGALALVGLVSWRDLRNEPTIPLKLAAGFFIRFAYHLADMFFFGYFRQNIAYHFFHHREDFLSLAEEGLPAKWLEALMSRESFRRVNAVDRFLASRPLRLIHRYFYIPFAGPLFQFLVRRVVLFIACQAAMGVLGGFAPFIPMGFGLVGLPYAGPGLVLMAHGIPILVGHVPFLGPILKPVFARATEALVGDLVLGPMLNAFLLSTFLTFPRTVGLRLMRELRAPPRPTEAAAIWPLRALKLAWRLSRAIGMTLVPWTPEGRNFWAMNILTFHGLLLVGAEIEGIMAYADQLDAGLAPLLKWTGRSYQPFHALGAAIERPRGKSPIPFGGAITWGNVLVYKAEAWSGLHVAEIILRATNHLVESVHPNAVTERLLQAHPKLPEGTSVPGLLPAASSRGEPPAIGGGSSGGGGGGSGGPPRVLPALSPPEKDEVGRLAGEMAKAGNLREELAKSKARIQDLRGRIVRGENRLRVVRGAKDDIPGAVRERYRQQLEALRYQRDQLYALRKLSERSDLANPVQSSQQIQAMDALLKAYDQILLEGTRDPGEMDSLAVKLAQLTALEQNLFRAERFNPQKAIGAASEADRARYAELEKALARVEKLRQSAQYELAARDASATVLESATRSRNLALRARRDGAGMLEFRKNFSRQAMVMDLTYSLGIVLSAQKTIVDMQALLDAKQKKIGSRLQADQQGQSDADAQSGNVSQWTETAKAAVKGDQTNGSDFNASAQEAAAALVQIPALRQSLSSMLSDINSQDRGSSVDAPAEYRRRLALLPTLQQYATGGYPGASNTDFSKLSLKSLRDQLNDVNAKLALVNSGIDKINQVPGELAGTLIWLVPGIPVVSGSSPDSDAVLRMLDARKAEFRDELAHYQALLNGVNTALDPNDPKTQPDDFGDPQPESIVYWLGQERRADSLESQNTAGALAKIDALAADINRLAGTSLAPLSGESLDGLIVDLPKYAAAINGLKMDLNTDQGFQAKMKILQLAQLLPYAGRHLLLWAEADRKVAALTDVVNRVLPQAQAKLQEAVNAVQAVQADIDLDVPYIQQNKANGDKDLHSDEEHKALIQRKLALLQNTLKPTLTDTAALLTGVLIPFQQASVQSLDSSSPQSPYELLYGNKLLVYNSIQDAYNKTLPWGLASSGGVYGDVPGSLAAIEQRRQFFQKDKRLLDDKQAELQKRLDPASTLTEQAYGETMPYSVLQRAKVYQAEKDRRAAEIHQQAARVNQILAQIDALAPGKYNLAAQYTLPTDIKGTGDASKRAVQALVDNNTIANLGAALKTIGKENDTGPVSVNVGAGTALPPPTGTQPKITLPDLLQTALLALQGAKQIVPSTADTPPLGYSVARYLFSDGVVAASNTWAAERLPIAQGIIQEGQGVLQQTFADLDTSVKYVQSQAQSETADQVLDREIALFRVQGAFAKKASDFFNNQMAVWDQEGVANMGQIASYYNGLHQVYSNGSDATQFEDQATRQMQGLLTQKYNELDKQRTEILGWLQQLNNPDETAMHRMADSLSALQEQTRQVVEANIPFHRLQGEFQAADAALRLSLNDLARAQDDLDAKLAEVDLAQVPPDLAARIREVGKRHGSWLLGGGDPSRQVLVIPKSEFPNFVSQIITNFFPPSSPRQDIGALQRQILSSPDRLAQLLPNSKMLSFGDEADGFYLVYQSDFGTPYGLETGSDLTLGNVAKVLGNNISLNGHRFESPPSPVNAPYGDQGVGVTMESLQGGPAVNYLDVDFHRLLSDVPKDDSIASSAGTTRMMIFDDFALLLIGDRLYIGAAGFGDFALADSRDKPYYYGGNFKTSFKMTEVASVNAEQAALFAKDPRTFLQSVNLDFTGYDPDINHDYIVASHGQDKQFYRTKVGPTLDVARAAGLKDSLKVDVYWSRLQGTDDNNQMALGASVLKGFTINRGQPGQTDISNRSTLEVGQSYNTYADQVQVAFPQGWIVNAEGKLVGPDSAYQVGLGKSLGDHSSISVSYGSPYLGLNNRLSINMDTQFTLGELWAAVIKTTKTEFEGGPVLEDFNKNLQAFFMDAPSDPLVTAELERVVRNDVGKKLLTQDVGRLTSDLQELYKAGAILDNTRVRGMIGFATNPVGGDSSDRWLGGGAQVGTYNEMTVTRSQKALISRKIVDIYAESLRLQERVVSLTQDYLAALFELVQAQWDMRLAQFIAANAPDGPIRAEGAARLQEAQARYDQAVLKYNAMTGRGPDEVPPFQDMNSRNLELLMAHLREKLKSPHRLSQVLQGLGPDQLPVPKQGINVMDYIPFLESLSLSFGLTYPEILDNQGLGLGIDLRLPIFDPSSPRADHAMVLEDRAVIEQMRQAYQAWRLRCEKERLTAQGYREAQESLRPQQARSARALTQAIPAYRNGLLSESDLWSAYREWHWYTSRTLEAEGQAALADAWGALDAGRSDPDLGRLLSSVPGAPPDYGRPRTDAPAPAASLGQAFDIARRRSHDVEELALRSQSAAEMMQAANSRISKAAVDFHLGWNVTVSGTDWIPSFGLTGFGVTPILDLTLKPGELKELQVAEQQGNSEIYGRLKAKAEADLALEVYESYILLKGSKDAWAYYQSTYLPELAARLGRVRASREAGPSAEAQARKAQFAYDQAALAAARLKSQALEAQAVFNFLMGDSLDQEVATNISPAEALSQLRTALAAARPVETHQAILEARVAVARDIEQGVDKGLKLQELQGEPVSLILRSLARLISALGDGTPANPEDAVKARRQTLEAERALANFGPDLQVARAQLESRTRACRERLKALEGVPGAAAAAERMGLQNDLSSLEGQRAMLGDSGAAAQEQAQDLPASYGDLQARLGRAQEGLVPRPGAEAGPPRGFSLDLERPAGQSYVRFYDHYQTIGKNPLNTANVEGWLELRLQSPDTPPEVLTALAGLQREEADQEYRTVLNGARAQTELLLARFGAQVRLWRWIERSRVNGGVPLGYGEIAERLSSEIAAEAADIKAALGLKPEITAGQIAALVPEPPAGAPEDLGAIASEFRGEIQSLRVETLKALLFDQGLPVGVFSQEQLIHQVRADAIVQRMSYKGFTPALAFGLFRGKLVGGAFLEAPDPTLIEKGLSDVLGDSLREDLKARGQLQAISLRLHSLMAEVQDKLVLLERQGRLAQAAEDDFRGKLVQFQSGALPLSELEAARAEVGQAWNGYFETLIALKLRFIELVSELRAIGYTAESGAAAGVPARDPGLASDSNDGLLDYWAHRLLDQDFETQTAALLRDLNVPPDRIAGLSAAARTYRDMAANASYLRAASMPEADRLRELTATDLEGRRLAVRARLKAVLDSLGEKDPQANPAWGTLVRFMTRDMDTQKAYAAVDLAGNARALEAMRGAYWRAVKSPWTVQGAEKRLEGLRADRDAKWQALLESYLSSPGRPGDFVIKDLSLDNYLKALDAYDQEVVLTFASREVRGDVGLARSLDTLFGLRASAARRASLLRCGRGLSALDALVALGQARLDALRWEKASPDDIQRVSEAIGRLQDLRSRWLEDPRDLKPLYAVTRLDGSGRRLWSVEGWLTSDDLAVPEFARRIVRVDGRLFLLPDGKTARTLGEVYALRAPELIGGVDQGQADAEARRAALADNQSEAAVLKVLETAEFAAQTQGGRGPAAPLSFGELFDPRTGLLSQGRVFYFSSTPNPSSGLRPALSALLAQTLDPDAYELWVYEGAKPLSRDAYPTLESLEASGDFRDFAKVRMGEKGAQALGAAARQKALALRRSGWISLKLYSYGFTLDRAGNPKDVYVTEGEWNQALRDIREAPGLARDLPPQVARLTAEAEARAKEEQAARAALEAAREREQAILAAKADARQAQREVSALKDKAEAAAKEALKARQAADELQRRLDQARDRVQGAREEAFRAADLEWSLAANGALVRVRAKAALGDQPLDISLGDAPAAQTVSGPVEAVAIESDGRVARVYRTPDELEAASGGMRLIAVDGREFRLSDRAVQPALRLRRYVDGQGRQILLSQDVLSSRLGDATGELGSARSWFYMPWNWANILLETPRGILKTPLEIYPGIDPNQDHYLGRVYMRKAAGGSAGHRDLLMAGLRQVDVLDLIPDHVERFYDPSQFPERVRLDRPLAPREQVFRDAPRSGDQDVRFGAGEGGMERYVRYAKEDIERSRARARIPFEGGVDVVTVETRRGRGPGWKGGTYTDSQVKSQAGEAAVVGAAASGLLPDTGDRVTVAGVPDNMETERVQAEVRVTLGAGRYDSLAQKLDAYPDRLRQRRAAVAAAGPGLRQAFDQGRSALQRAQGDVAAAWSQERSAQDSAASLARRIGAEGARLEEERSLVAGLRGLEHRLQVERAYFAELKRRAARHGGPPPSPPGHPGSPGVGGGPTPPGPTGPGEHPPQVGVSPRPFYRYAVMAFAFGLVLLTVFDLLGGLWRKKV